MKNLWAKAKALPQRSVVAVLLILISTFGQFLSFATTLCILGAILFPCCFCMLKKEHLVNEFGRSPTFRWVGAYLSLFLLSTLITMTASKDWALLSQSVLICSLYLLFVPKSHSKNDMRSEVFWLACLMVGLYLPLELLALLSVFTGKVFHLPLFTGVVGITTAGSVSDRIRIFGNTNTVAIIAAMNVLLSIYAISASQKKHTKAFFIFAILVNYITLSHTLSRTSSIAFSAAVAALAFRNVFLQITKRKLRWIAGIAAALAAFWIVLNGINGIYKTDILIAQRLTAKNVEVATEISEVTSRIDTQGQFNVNSSGRGDIWISTLKYMKNHPLILLFGQGQVDSIEWIGKEYPEISQYLNIHNSYLAAAFYCGVPFLICVLLFLGTLVPSAVRMLLRKEDCEERGNFVFPIMVGMILITGIGEELLFVKLSCPNFMLYLFCGYLLRFGSPEKAQIERNHTNEN